MGKDLLILREAVINKVHPARHASFGLFGKLMPKSRTNCVANLGMIPGKACAVSCHSNHCERE